MVVLLDTFKALKPWQVVVLVAVLLGGTGATFGVYSLIISSGGAGLGEDQQLIPIQYGDLVNQVSTNGSLIFPNREILTFDTQGTLGELLVEEGHSVEEDQALASLDQTTLASLEKAVAQAQVNLRNAEDALAEAKSPHTSLDMAQAEAKVANAKVSLQNSQDALDRLLEPTTQDIAQAEANVANARLALQNAQDALSRVLEPTAQDIAQAEATVTNAKLSVRNAEEALETVLSGPSDEDIAQAQSQVDSDSTALANAQGDLSLAEREWNGNMESAQDAFNTSLESYQIVLQKWLGVDPEEIEEALDPDTLLDSWGVDLASLFDPNSRFQDTRIPFLSQGPPPDNPATHWSEFVVYSWMNLYPGTVLPTCEDGVISSGALCAEKELDDAWAALESHSNDLDTVETQATKAINNAEITVTRAEETLMASQKAMSDLEADPDPLELESKENQLALAVAILQQAEEDLSNLKNDTDAVEVELDEQQIAATQNSLAKSEKDTEEAQRQLQDLEVEAKRKQVAVAQANLDEAEQELAELLGEPDAVEMEAKRNQAAVAEANLDQAKEELAELQGSVDLLEVALRDANVLSAQLALDTAVQRLEGGILRAPMAGIVFLGNVEAGQAVNLNTRIVEVVDTSIVEVDGIVDEIDVLFVREGARAEVTMDALPGEVLEGKVSYIAPTGQSQQGVVSYPIRIQLQLPEGVQLPEGLSAVANIVLREERDVLLVPLQALYGTFEQPLVRVFTGGRIEERTVALGNNDDFWVVVSEGLAEGEQVVMETTQASTSQFGFGFGRGGFPGGGFPGGGQGPQRQPNR